VVPTGKHFGLFVKLLKGLGFPLSVMVDKDAVINIEQSIKVGDKRVDTSSVFSNLYKIGFLAKEDLQRITEFESEIIEKFVLNKKKRFYPEKLFKEMKEMALKYKVYILSSDFEGVLKKEGYKELLSEAASIADSKVIQGRFVAERIVEEGKDIPAEVRAVNNTTKELVAPVE
jgi:hypothetical protein